MSGHRVYLDTETTGLDPRRHEVWEVAAIVVGHADHQLDGVWVWRIRPERLADADPNGLRICRYYQRTADAGWSPTNPAYLVSGPTPATAASRCWDPTPRTEVTARLARILDRATIYGSAPHFDTGFLDAQFRADGHCPTWDHHLVDLSTLARGWLRGRGLTLPDPLRSEALSRACGVEPPTGDERHSARGDARWVYRWHAAIEPELFPPAPDADPHAAAANAAA